MYKLKEMILMLCFILSGALCYVHAEAGTLEERDGITIDLVQASTYSRPSKGNSIIPTINGHVLTVVFNENMGQVSVVVATTSGATVESLSVPTPNGIQVYIPNAGNYIVTFTLSDGDMYAGEFIVTD